jgi:hypothetical protein
LIPEKITRPKPKLLSPKKNTYFFFSHLIGGIQLNGFAVLSFGFGKSSKFRVTFCNSHNSLIEKRINTTSELETQLVFTRLGRFLADVDSAQKYIL